MIDKCPELAPTLKTKDIRAQIKPFRDVIKRFSQARNQHMAHRDTTGTTAQVYWPEPRDLLEMGHSIFNEIKIAGLHVSARFDKLPAKSHLEALMQSLMNIEKNRMGGDI